MNREDIEIGVYQIPLLKKQGRKLMGVLGTDSVSKAIMQLVANKLNEELE